MNQKFEIEDTEFEGLKIVHPFVAYDERGFFMKTYEREFFASHGIVLNNDEDMTTCSRQNVVRGMHFQLKYPQDKYITVSIGTIYDVVVDLRKGSQTFGRWKGIELSDENKLGFYIPAGFAHGFVAVSELVKFHYRCGGKYMPEYDSGILWNDKDIGIAWSYLKGKPIVSERDKALMSFQEFCQKYQGLEVG